MGYNQYFESSEEYENVTVLLTRLYENQVNESVLCDTLKVYLLVDELIERD